MTISAKQGLAYESQGALVVDIAEEGDSNTFPPCIVRKSDWSGLYATLIWLPLLREKRASIRIRYIYIADKMLGFHFTQVFRVAKKSGNCKTGYATIGIFGIGTIQGRKAVFTRDGGVMRPATVLLPINEQYLTA